MARIRSVHPEICLDETLAEVSASAERTFVRLWPHLDDEGRARANIKLLRAACYPLHDDVTNADVTSDLDELANVGLIVRYTVGGQEYLTAKPDAWKRWQKPRHFYPSKLPGPESAQRALTDMNVGRESDDSPTGDGLELVELRGVGDGAAADASDAGPTTVRLTAERRQHIFDQALDILVARHIARHPTTGRRERHEEATRNGKRTDHQTTAHATLIANPTMTAEQLADELEPNLKPLRSLDDLLPRVPEYQPPAPIDVVAPQTDSARAALAASRLHQETQK